MGSLLFGPFWVLLGRLLAAGKVNEVGGRTGRSFVCTSGFGAQLGGR